MSLLARQSAPQRGPSPRHWFGQGAQEPYAKALRSGRGTLILEPHAVGSAVAPVHVSIQQWCEAATPAEVSLLLASAGPVLDAGCGPGRMLVAAESVGLRALGVDVSSEAVAQARSRGTRALHQSIFEPVPCEGTWGTVLLLDGNVGIGGSVPVLLRRMDQVLASTGSILIEVEAQECLDASYTAVLRGEGTEVSEPFAWARVGARALEKYAADAGWEVDRWTTFTSTQRTAVPVPAPCQERAVCWLVRREWRSTASTATVAATTKIAQNTPRANA